MFQTGKVYKVKVEVSPGEVGFGRATIVDNQSGKIYVQLKTSKDANQVLPKGSRVWFVGDFAANLFNGMWATTVTGAKIVSGHTVMECRAPRFEPQTQKRKALRYPFSCRVRLLTEPGHDVDYQLYAFNISRSGIGIETLEKEVSEFPTGESVDIVIETKEGSIPVNCRVIRTEYNWLVNRTTVGLEFVEMSEESRAVLDKLIKTLSTAGAVADETGTEKKKEGLSGWLRSSKADISLVRAREAPPPPPEPYAETPGDDNGGNHHSDSD